MPFEEYWIGKGLPLDDLWRDFDSGTEYIRKFKSIDPYVLRLTFENHPLASPLFDHFDHEILYKTVKGTFHDVKQECLSRNAYEEAAPIFLYRVERGSGIFEFLGEFDPILTYVTALGAAMMYYRIAIQKDQDFDEKKWKFIRTNFPRASDTDIQAYMKAWTTWGRRRILQRLIEQGLHRIEVSKDSFKGDKSSSEVEMVDITKLLEKESEEEDI